MTQLMLLLTTAHYLKMDLNNTIMYTMLAYLKMLKLFMKEIALFKKFLD